jgi:competence protein ComEA
VEAFTLSRRRALALALVAVALVALGARFLVNAGSSATAKPARLVPLARERPPDLLVHVVGEVRRPGLYRLGDGGRIADAIARAGGATEAADLALVNLAAPLVDGTQISVPARAPAGGAPGGGSPAGAAPGPVRLNTATVEELDALPGVGPVTAGKIVEYRQAHGPFASIDDLDAVPGIGPARLEELRELVAL